VMYQGREYSIAFNPEFLMAPLRNLSEDEIYLDLIDELSPGVIKIAGPFLYVLMPVRLQVKRLPDRDGGGSFDEGLRGDFNKIAGRVMATPGYSGGAPTECFCSE
jgi:hypothetical protein